MPEWWVIALGVVGGLLILWAALVVTLWIQQRRAGSRTDWRAIVRLAPDVLRLVRRLIADRSVPRTTRWWLIALLAYLVMPIDLIPDVVPVIWYSDDAIVVAVAIRFAVRHAGLPAIERHWPGTTEGLRSVLSLCGLDAHTCRSSIGTHGRPAIETCDGNTILDLQAPEP